jgi:hypothetical protein
MSVEVMELIDPSWDVFSPALTDDSTRQLDYYSYKPLGQTQVGTIFGATTPIEFNITDSGKYINLSKTYIDLAVQLIKTGTVASPQYFATGAPVALEMDVCRLFSRVELVAGK